jgi:Tfp pilus assembly protein PilF
MSPPDAGDLKRALAEDQTQAKQYDAALKTYQEMITDDPNDAQAHLSMSRIYRETHDLKKARAMSDKAKTLEPYNVEIRYNEVGILEAEGKPVEALKVMKELVLSTERRTYNPREKEVRISLLDDLAQMYLTAEQTDAAVDALRQIVDLDPDKGPAVSTQIVEAYRQGKEFQKAEQESDAAVKKYPTNAPVHAAHALVLADAGKIDPAVVEVKKFLGPGSDAAGKGKADRTYYASLAQVYEKGHKWDEEAKALDAAEKLSESNREKQAIWFSRGAMYEKMKKLDASESEFRKILQADPENAGALNYLGYMLADRGVRLNEALQMISKAVEQEPASGAYLDSLGWVYFKLGKLPEAEENIRKALETTPRDATVRDHLGDVLLRESKVREAVAQWEISLKEWNASSPADLEPEQVAKVKTKLDGAKIRLAQENKQQQF